MKILSVMTLDSSAPASAPGAHDIEVMSELLADLRSKGALIETGGRLPGMLELIIARKNGKTTVTDGPFTEAKEVVGGFALLDVKDREEAIALTKRFMDLAGDVTCHLHEVDLPPV